MTRPIDTQDIQALWMGQKEGYKNAIDDALEIIDKESDYIESKYAYGEVFSYQDYVHHWTVVRRAVLALKGGEKE